MRALIGFGCGALFGLGLIESTLWDPRTVGGFLDFAAWDQRLLVAMASAVAVQMTLLSWAVKRPRPVLAERFDPPVGGVVNARLISGSALFGVGWGIAGVCPGSAFVRMGAGAPDAWVFLPSMLLGFALFALAQRLRTPSAAGPDMVA